MTLNRITQFLATCATSLALITPATAQVVQYDASDVVKVTMLNGWRADGGRHFAALKFDLAPGWKTFWRAPGDGGFPTRLNWSSSQNLEDVTILWPKPQVFRQNGLRSIGYHTEFVLPLSFQATSDGPIFVDGQLNFGVCDEFCLPVTLDLHLMLPPEQTTPVEEIAAALRKQPISAAQAMVRQVRCRASVRDGRAWIDVELLMPPLGGKGEAMVIEASDPSLWISEPFVTRVGDTLRATAEVITRNGKPFRPNLERLRLTVLTTQRAVDIHGCS